MLKAHRLKAGGLNPVMDNQKQDGKMNRIVMVAVMVLLSGADAYTKNIHGQQQMPQTYMLPLFVALVLVVLVILKVRKPAAVGSVRYCRGRFLSQNEKEFLGTLDRVVGARYRVFAQVRLADLIDVEASGNQTARWNSLRQVFGKSVDFVICNATTFDPVLLIEVDDRSHERGDRRARDVLVNRACDEAGLRLLRVKARFSYAEGELAKKLQAAGLGLAPNLAAARGSAGAG